MMEKTKFYHTDEFDYFKKQYDFFETRTLSDEEMRFQIETRKTLNMESMAKTLKFFKILVIIYIILYIINRFIVLLSLA